MKGLALLFGLLHSASAMVLLLFSGWFIASCALYGSDYATFNFNYLLPAVIIRALALTRIASGYAHLWIGHRDLLNTLKNVRLRLFKRLKDQRIVRRAFGTEALAKHSESIAAITIAWTAHNLAFVLIILLMSTAIGLYLTEWFFPWLGFLALIVALLVLTVFSLKKRTQQITKQETEHRHTSEHHLLSAPLWHLQSRIRHPDMGALYRSKTHNHNTSERMLWWVQLVAFALLLYVLWTTPQGNDAALMILLLLLLSARDWLAPVFHSQKELAEYQQSKAAFNHLPLKAITPIARPPSDISQLVLRDFAVPNRSLAVLDLTLNAGESLLLTGESGVGKTSLIKAIAGLLPHTGEKRVNQQILDSGFINTWHYTAQTPQVISASLAANLRLAQPNASDEQLLQALSSVQLANLYNLEEWIGDNGRQLSGGELKRLALARAYLFDAQLYLLDEPFEGLNAEQQAAIAELINQLSQRAPIIIASHIQPSNLRIDQCVKLG